MALVDSFKAHNANIRTKHGVKNLELAGGEVGTTQGRLIAAPFERESSWHW